MDHTIPPGLSGFSNFSPQDLSASTSPSLVINGLKLLSTFDALL
jgi:hypothetical protein